MSANKKVVKDLFVLGIVLFILVSVFALGLYALLVSVQKTEAASPSNNVSNDRGSEEPEPIADTVYFVTYARLDLSMKPDFVVAQIVGPEGVVAEDVFFMPLVDQDIVDIRVEQKDSDLFRTAGHIRYVITFDTNGSDPMCSLSMPTEPNQVWRFSCASIPT